MLWRIGAGIVRPLLTAMLVVIVGCGTETQEPPGNNDPSDSTDSDDVVQPSTLPEGCTVLLEPEGDIQSSVQLAFIDAKDGDSICFAEGTYAFTDEISLSVSGVTVRSAVAGSLVLFEFANQEAGANGVSITGDRFTMDGINVMNAPGDGIRITAASDVTIRNTLVGWDGRGAKGVAPGEEGAYGFYPVGCSNVLLEDNVVFGAVDAGVYVGQSSNIIVRRNEVYGNVAGIEIENSTHAEVYDNDVHDNTAGILVFDLPELPVYGGQYTEVHSNRIDSNNVQNFAPPGFIVAAVPTGTGIILVASKNTEIHNNIVTNHVSTAIALASIFLIDDDYEDEQYDPYVQSTYIYDNTLENNGFAPKDLFMGVSLILNGGELGPIPQILWDGYTNPAWDADIDEYTHCIVNNGDADFINCDWENQFEDYSTDASPHNCTRDTFDPVEF
jgi:parallel beta-helix repeat protein